MGDVVIGDECARQLEQLTPREREVLRFIAEGLSTPQIADRLFRSEKTIESHRQSLAKKLGLRNRVELTRYAIQAGVTVLPRANEPGIEQAAELTREREDRVRMMQHALNLVSDAVIIRDAQGRIIFLNRAAEELTGWQAETAISNELPEQFVPTFEESIADVMKDAMTHGSTCRPARIQRCDGTTLHVEINLHIQRNEVGTPLGVIEIWRAQP